MKTATEAIQFLNALVTKIQSGIITFDIEGRVTMVNQKALDYLKVGGTVAQIVDTLVLTHITIDELAASIKNCLSKSRKDFHLTNIAVDGRYLVIDGVKLLDGMMLTISDITDTVRSKDKATQSLLLGIETERRRLAKEIHDGVGPNMSTIKLQIDAVKRKLTDEHIIDGLNKVNETISEIASEIRQISHDLMPSSLIDFGVVTALGNFSKRVNQTDKIQVVYQAEIQDGYLSKEHELNIYRIVQELVNNAIKYSSCQRINIDIAEQEGKVLIRVEDDGVGMALHQIEEGMGLHNINTRVDSLQGVFTLDSQAGKGVAALIELPITLN